MLQLLSRTWSSYKIPSLCEAFKLIFHSFCFILCGQLTLSVLFPNLSMLFQVSTVRPLPAVPLYSAHAFFEPLYISLSSCGNVYLKSVGRITFFLFCALKYLLLFAIYIANYSTIANYNYICIYLHIFS